MTNWMNESKRTFHLDYLLVIIIGLSAFAGIVGIYLSSPLNNLDDSHSDIVRQIIWFIISGSFSFVLIKMGVDRIFTMAYPVYYILLILLFGQVLARYGVFSTSFITPVNGAYAWYQIPGVGSFQPSEFMKITLIFITANIITKHNKEKEGMLFSEDFALIFKIARYALPPLALIVLQPDTGIPIIIVVSLAVMFFMSGVRREWVVIIGSLVAVVFFGIIFLYYNNPALLNKLFGGTAQNYRLNRFYGWLDFEKYANDQGHHLYNAIASLGTAGWFGHPLKTVILQFPESQTDFIFAVLSQNFGFIGSAVVIILAFSLDLRIAWIALSTDLQREKVLLIGVLGMLIFQHFQNIGMVIGILPITGITLPFFSYGGSSILSYIIPISVAFHTYSEIKNAHQH